MNMKRFVLNWRYPFFIVVLLVITISCTKNQRTKNFGAAQTIHLPKNQKLVVVTWKNDDLWYLYKPMREDEIPESTTFQENSSFGIFNGKITFVESK